MCLDDDEVYRVTKFHENSEQIVNIRKVQTVGRLGSRRVRPVAFSQVPSLSLGLRWRFTTVKCSAALLTQVCT